MEACMEAAVRYLSYRSRTQKEVEAHLLKKGFDAETIKEVMKRLREYHYVDDALYLKNYLANNEQVQKYGKKRLIQDLRRRELDEALIQKLDEDYPLQAEEKRCRTLAKKFVLSVKGKTVRERKKKIYDKLLRMGYGNELVLEALSRLDWKMDEEDEAALNREIMTKLRKDFEKYQQKHRKKGAAGYELSQKIFRSLAMRGYPYEMIQTVMEENRSDE